MESRTLLNLTLKPEFEKSSGLDCLRRTDEAQSPLLDGVVDPTKEDDQKIEYRPFMRSVYWYKLFKRPLSTNSRTKPSSKKSLGFAVFAAGILSARLSSTARTPFSDGAGALSRYFPE
jgi:hypothetical protein